MKLKFSIIANYFGQGYVAIIGIVIVPYLLGRLGTEVYGLIGFFSMLQGWLQLLDMGISGTVSREAARSITSSENKIIFGLLLKKVVILFVFMACAFSIIFWLVSPWISEYWLSSSKINQNDLVYAVEIIGITVACRWFIGPLRGILPGLERQYLANILIMIFATLKFGFVLWVLDAFGSNVRVYFTYQLIVAVVEAITYFALSFPHVQFLKTKKQSYPSQLSTIYKFALSIGFTSAIWVVVTQMDKIILSKFLSLSDYGLYSIAIVAASGISLLSGPIGGAIQPRLSRLYAEKNMVQFFRKYSQTTQVVANLVAPISIIMAFFSKEILFVWTGNFVLACGASGILRWYALGNAVVALVAFPYYMQYAFGDLTYHVKANLIYPIFVIPLVIFGCVYWGAVGAGVAWFVCNVLYLMFFTAIVHKRFWPNNHFKWLCFDVLKPFLICVSICFFAKMAFVLGNRIQVLGFILIVLLMSVFFLIGLNNEFRSKFLFWKK